MRPSDRFLIGVAATVLAVSACTSSAIPTPTEDSLATPHPKLVTSESGIFGALLALVPDTPDTRQGTWVNDYAHVRDLYGITLVGPDRQPKEAGRYRQELETVVGYNLEERSWISGLSFQMDLDQPVFSERRRYLGFDARDVDQTVYAGHEPKFLEILQGRFDPSAIRMALDLCECPQPTREEHRGVGYYRWGDDFATSAALQNAPPVFDPYGRGSNLVVQDRFVFRTVYQEGAKSLIETQRGSFPSLRDAEGFVLLARAMGGLDVYSAFFSDDTMAPSPVDVPEMRQRGDTAPTATERMRTVVAQGPLLLPYESLAVGRGRDERGRYLALALVHRDKDVAEKNVGRLQERIERTGLVWQENARWTDLIDEAEVWSEGRLLLAKVRGDRASGFSLDVFIAGGEPLLVHEAP